MAQHDMVIDNGPGLAVRTDMNAAVLALVTCSSGPVEPLVPYAGMLWLDTSASVQGLLRQRNQSNSGWIDAQVAPEARFSDADLSFFSRLSPPRFVWNDKADGTGTDIAVLDELGNLIVNSISIAGGGQPLSRIVTLPKILTTTVYTKPVGLRYLSVEGQAPGGGAGGAAATAAGVSGCSGGAGAGAWGKRIFAASELATDTPITVGSRGFGGTGTSGSSGGACEFGTGLNCTLGGGVGTPRTTNAPTMIRGDGGAGGAPGTGWTLSCYGESGGCGYGCAANNFNYAQRGAGANSKYGIGAVEAISTNLGGIDGTGFGAGGGGTGNAQSQAANKTGGDGAPAFFQLMEIY